MNLKGQNSYSTKSESVLIKHASLIVQSIFLFRLIWDNYYAKFNKKFKFKLVF